MEHVVENFSKQQRSKTQQAQYTVCALFGDLPSHIRPFELCTLTQSIRPGAIIQVPGSGEHLMQGTIKTVVQGEFEFAPDPTVCLNPFFFQN